MEHQLALFVETKIILPRSMKVNTLTVKKIILLDNVPPLKLLVTFVKEMTMPLSNAPSTPWWNKGNKKDPSIPRMLMAKEKDHLYLQARQPNSKDQRNQDQT